MSFMDKINQGLSVVTEPFDRAANAILKGPVGRVMLSEKGYKNMCEHNSPADEVPENNEIS